MTHSKSLISFGFNSKPCFCNTKLRNQNLFLPINQQNPKHTKQTNIIKNNEENETPTGEMNFYFANAMKIKAKN